MKKIFFLFLLTLSLFAEPRPSEKDLDACYQRNKASEFFYNGLRAVALTRHLAAVIPDGNTTLEPDEYVKYDPYLKLYLVEIDTTEVAPHMFDETSLKNDSWVNVLDYNVSQIGHISSFSQNIGEYDKLDFYPTKTGILLCDCCQMVGIAVGGNNFIGSRYLRNFVKYRDVYYGDIGVNFDEVDGKLRVRSVNPFGVGAKLQVADIISTVNGIPPKDLRELYETILFTPKGNTIRFEVLRNDKRQVLHVTMPLYTKNSDNNTTITKKDNKKTELVVPKTTPKKNYDPNKAKNTLYSNYGFSVNNNMIVSSVKNNSPAKKTGLRVGDKIMQVGKTPVKTPTELWRLLGKNYRLNHVLVSRDDFQFFIRIRR